MSLVINHNLMANNAARNLDSSYGALATSTRRLSSGLRITSAADDAAGLAIRELMRSDVSTMHQGIRNANDAVSLIQVADGALQVIDEKLIRMNELAEQAATGTYNSDQRLIIDSEFQAMASEITRIASATNFNGIYLLNGNLSSSEHNGTGIGPTGKLKVHFGTSNDSSEDYYYIQIGDSSVDGLGLSKKSNAATIPLLSDVLTNGAALEQFPSGIVSFSVIPAGTRNLSVHLYDNGANDSLEVFTTNGRHLVGTSLGSTDWSSAGVSNIIDMNTTVLTQSNGFNTGTSYNGTSLNGIGGDVPFNPVDPYNTFSYNGMNFGYSGDGNSGSNYHEYLTLDNANEDLIVLSVGSGVFDIQASWDYMPNSLNQGKVISISTQELAQQALDQIRTAIVSKDTIRANLGAVQNRLANTISNLEIQAENLMSAESQISDVDVANEMTEFVRQQILTQAAVAMLTQANSLPKMAMQLISG